MSTTDTTPTTPTTPTAPGILSAADRCDRCGAQAYLRVELLSGGDLLFCAHHAREHEDAIKPLAAHITDNRTALQKEEVPTI